jgi:two-component system, OmpR family, phosphate regulon response regulator PhoB
VTAVEDGEDPIAAVDRHNPDLVMLDWDLPGVVTLDLVRHVRSNLHARRTRVIGLSAFSREQQIVAGLELGLEDYVVRPYSLPELIARVRAVLRSVRQRSIDGDHLECGPIRLDAADGRVQIRQQVVHLRAGEIRLLQFLMQHPGRLFSREQLLAAVWGHDRTASERAVDVTVQRIRTALGPHGCDGHLQTVRGLGYRLSADDEVL